MKGFTLVELMVVFVILSVLGGAAIIRYNAFNRDQVLKQTGLSLRNDLRLVQAKAIASLKPLSGCTTLEGYTVSFTETTYISRASCSEGAVGTVNTVTLPTHISFNPVPSPITFPVLTTTIASAVTITLESSSRSYAISISSNGDIHDEGYQ